MAEIDVFGYSFSATAYITDFNQEEPLAVMSQKFGFPFISASRAIGRTLNRLNVRRLALFNPYPN